MEPSKSPIQGNKHFLGLDVSTQSIKAIILDNNQRVVQEEHLSFDDSFPHYNTTDGVLKDPLNPLIVNAPSLMFVDALESILERISKSFDLAKISAISGSAQQHSSIYWKNGAHKILRNLQYDQTLTHQLRDAFSVENGPIWMDSSTEVQCRRLESEIGGAQRLANLTGSRAYERFTGNQIAKLIQRNLQVYKNTERISLVSSMMSTLLLGKYAPIDQSDASGMNLMDLETGNWSQELLDIVSEHNPDELAEKLGAPIPSHHVIGRISSYFCQRFGFSSECLLIPFSGDNPCALAGFRLQNCGDVVVSLGTSTTLLSILNNPKPSGEEGHVLQSPIDPSSFMGMLCFKNGAFARKVVRNEIASGSWKRFEELVNQTPPGNNGNIGFFFQVPEIMPTTHKAGIIRFDDQDEIVSGRFEDNIEARAVIEFQALSLRLHAEHLGVDTKRLLVTGGASDNLTIIQIISNVFGCPVYSSDEGKEAAALGGALRAIHGYQCETAKQFIPFSNIANSKFVKLADHVPSAHKLYSGMLSRLEKLERQIVSILNE